MCTIISAACAHVRFKRLVGFGRGPCWIRPLDLRVAARVRLRGKSALGANDCRGMFLFEARVRGVRFNMCASR